MQPGRSEFADYLRFGAGLQLVTLATLMVVAAIVT